ncbi:MAG: hypothetical protein IMF05_10340 [Proteobacteria bacterium]|nr:hypothetical protein [Pseudomonadota bacterium]
MRNRRGNGERGDGAAPGLAPAAPAAGAARELTLEYTEVTRELTTRYTKTARELTRELTRGYTETTLEITLENGGAAVAAEFAPSAAETGLPGGGKVIKSNPAGSRESGAGFPERGWRPDPIGFSAAMWDSIPGRGTGRA